MERIQLRKRSASHGPLARSSSIDPGALPHMRNTRRQLQPLDGNTVFLASPAPFESLLRKTTETGDIGFFSIGSVRSLDAVYDLARPKAPRHGPTNVEAAFVRGVGGPDLTDDRRSLPSYRNSTTGSDKTAYGARSFSSRSTVGDRRSYSMTTCSSTSTWAKQTTYPPRPLERSRWVSPSRTRFNCLEDPGNAFDKSPMAPLSSVTPNEIPDVCPAEVFD